MSLTANQKNELACTYAAFLLYDSGLDITATNLKNVAKAAGFALDDFWANTFAKFANKELLDTLVEKLTKPGVAPAAVAPAQVTEKKEEEKEEKKEEEKEESASGEDMGFGLFGDDDD